MRFAIIVAIFATAISAATEPEDRCAHCCSVCFQQVGNGIADNGMLGNCWGNCAAYACGGRCSNEKYNP